MASNLNTIVGKNIRKYRKLKGVSQEKFAELCDLHRTYVGSVERGERNITLKILEKFALALCLEPKDLLDKDHQELRDMDKVLNYGDCLEPKDLLDYGDRPRPKGQTLI